MLLADGAAALADAGSVDRVIATAAVQLGRLPYAWVQQARPGGVILAPVRAELASGPLVRLEVGSEGTARGGPCGCGSGSSSCAPSELRARRSLRCGGTIPRWSLPAPMSTRSRRCCTRRRAGRSRSVCRHAAMTWRNAPVSRGHGVAWLLDPITGSWASVVPTTPRSENYLTRQTGPRRLWDEAATAYRCWDQQGQPPIEAWQWTITSHQQRINLT